MRNYKKILTAVGFLGVVSLLAGCNNTPSSDNNEPSKHEHSLTHHAAVASTCTTKGSIEYWSCTGCEGKFSDENGEHQITSIEAPLGAHNGVHHDLVPSTCLAQGTVEYWECSVCHEKFSDEECKEKITSTQLPLGAHNGVHHEAEASSCVTHGTVEYWECSVCHEKFSDAACSNEITSIEAPLADHNYNFVAEVAPSETANGTMAHYECTVCNALFTKVSDTYQETTANDLVIPKLVYFDVTFACDGVDSQHIISGGKVTQPAVTPTKAADASYTYSFKEWQLNDEAFDFDNDVVTADITLTPAFNKTPVNYTLTFKVKGQADVVRNFNCETESIEVPALPEAPQGYSNSWSAYDLELLENQEVTVVISPRDDTPYKVNHYLPKLDGTGFNLYEEENKQGTTDANTAAEGKTIVGFTAQDISQKIIAADGSAVVDVYYTRNDFKLAKDKDVDATIEMVEDGLPSHQKITLTTNQYGIAWTSLVPNFTKEELESSDGIEFVVKLPQKGTLMCSNSNQFAKNIEGNNFQVVRLPLSEIERDYHGKADLEAVYNHMIYPGSRGLGFLFSEAKNSEVSIELFSANLYKGELSPLANKHVNGHVDQAQKSIFVNANNISKFADAPALPEGVSGMLRVQAASNSYGVTDFRINPTGLVSKEEMLDASEIVMKVYAVAGEGKPNTFNAFLNNEHFSKDNATGSWIDVKIPTRLIGAQEKCASLAAAYDSMVGGWVRMPQFQFKLNGSAFTGGNVVFYIAGVRSINKISTLVNNAHVDNQTITYVDSSNVGSISGAPSLPSGKSAMIKVDAKSNQYGVSLLRLNPTNFFTEEQLRAAKTVDITLYMKKGSGTTFNAMLKDTEYFNKNLAVEEWVTINVPVQLLLSQLSANGYSDITGGWINFAQFVYDKNATITYYISGVSLNNEPLLNANNANKVMFIESDQGSYENTWVTSANKTANDPDMPAGYNGYVKLVVTTNQYGLCDIRFDSGLLNLLNYKYGSKISFKLYCTGEGIDSTVALSKDNSHNYGSKNANAWIDFEYDLADVGDASTRSSQDKWVSLCRVQFKKGGAALNKGLVTVYLADITIK